MRSSSREWALVDKGWFRRATTDELREFVEAMDKGEVPEGEKGEELKREFYEECNRRSGRDYERRNGGEWI